MLQISYSQFYDVVAGCVRTLSGKCRPLTDERALSYETTVAKLAAASVFAPRFTDSTRSKIVPFDDPDGYPILLRDFARREDFGGALIHGGTWPEDSLQVVLLECSLCGKAVLIDGLHRTTQAIRSMALNTPAQAYVLSGLHWPAGTPDMNIVCECLNPTRR